MCRGRFTKTEGKWVFFKTIALKVNIETLISEIYSIIHDSCIFLLSFFQMQAMYEGPEDLVEKMKSLSVSQDCSLGGECRFRYELPRFKYDNSGGCCQHGHAYRDWSVTSIKKLTFLLDLQIVQLHWWVRKVSRCRLKPVSRTCTLSRHHRSVSRVMLGRSEVLLLWKKNWIRSSNTTNWATMGATPSLKLLMATFAALPIISCQTCALITPLHTRDKTGRLTPRLFTPLQKLRLCILSARRSAGTTPLVNSLCPWNLCPRNHACQHPAACLSCHSPTRNIIFILCLTVKSLGQPSQWRTHLPLKSTPGVCWRLPTADCYKTQVDMQTCASGQMFCETWLHMLMVPMPLIDM